MRALDIITDAYERCNRLSPAEELSADDAAYGLRRLNLLVDELSASNVYLFKDVLTSNAITGNIALGTGLWASLGAGTDIVSATVNGYPITKITMQQYNEMFKTASSGTPRYYAESGTDTVYLYPQANGQTITLQTRTGVQTFTDLLTDYTLLSGWATALGAGLAVRIAANIMGAIPPYLIQAEKTAMKNVQKQDPMIINAGSYTGARSSSITGLMNGW